MQRTYVYRQGFTIVELLIVIVIIGVLAAVSIVTYGGVQNNANDAIVSQDLAQFAKQIQLIQAQTGEFPAGGAVTSVEGASAAGSSNQFPNVTSKFSRQAYYNTSGLNLTYCTGVDTASGQAIFRIVGRSKSGKSFAYDSLKGLYNSDPYTPHNNTACRGIGYPRSVAWGMREDGGWNTWALAN